MCCKNENRSISVKSIKNWYMLLYTFPLVSNSYLMKKVWLSSAVMILYTKIIKGDKGVLLITY